MGLMNFCLLAFSTFPLRNPTVAQNAKYLAGNYSEYHKIKFTFQLKSMPDPRYYHHAFAVRPGSLNQIEPETRVWRKFTRNPHEFLSLLVLSHIFVWKIVRRSYETWAVIRVIRFECPRMKFVPLGFSLSSLCLDCVNSVIKYAPVDNSFDNYSRVWLACRSFPDEFLRWWLNWETFAHRNSRACWMHDVSCAVILYEKSNQPDASTIFNYNRHAVGDDICLLNNVWSTTGGGTDYATI